MLISYSDKSKSGTYRLGIVEGVEWDTDNLVRTCEVSYRLVRSDLPADELRFYFKGLKYKKIRVPVQRLCVILPVEEQEFSPFLCKKPSEEKGFSETFGDGDSQDGLEVPKDNEKEIESSKDIHSEVDVSGFDQKSHIPKNKLYQVIDCIKKCI